MNHPSRRPLRLTSLALLVLAIPSGVASAQAELDGSFIDYVAVGANGTMLGASSHSMRYREVATDDYSCDVWSTDTRVSSFTVAADAAGIFSDVSATNDNGAFNGFVTTSSTIIVGRTITWSGVAGSGLLGAGAIGVSHTYSFQPDDRVMIQTITLRNVGYVPFGSVYYMVHGDPDHGRCGIGSSNDTANDVVRQQMGAVGSLAVASTISTVSPKVVIGLGSHASNARVDFSPGISDTNVVSAWQSPDDPEGEEGDRGMSVAFRFTNLAVGGSVSFQVFYVWGSSVASVVDRFDQAVCAVQPDAGTCDPGDTDTDGDGVVDAVESPGGVDRDTDMDGTVDREDTDDDGDGIPTRDEREDEAALGGDVDADGIPAYLDLDSDGDGFLDENEGRSDADTNGKPDYLDAVAMPDDTDGDGIPDEIECLAMPCPDSDGDGTPDLEDPDDDDDGIPTSVEVDEETAQGGDVDGDGIPAHLDPDSDGDGILDGDEADGDTDGDGIPDRLDAVDDSANGGGRIVGGALCATSPGSQGSPVAFAILLIAVAALARRRGAR